MDLIHHGQYHNRRPTPFDYKPPMHKDCRSTTYVQTTSCSMIGCQLKTLAQVNIFHVYDLVDPLWFVLMKAIGELCALL
jgi:hypothetical protein